MLMIEDNFFSLTDCRQLVKHMFQTYLPTFIIVFVSWLSFLVPPAAYPGRMGMLVVLVLVIINIMLKVVEMSPMSSGICGLTLWTIICLITVSYYGSIIGLIGFLAVTLIAYHCAEIILFSR